MAEEKKVTVTQPESEVPERMESEALFSPEVDIVEKEGSIVLLADMPGVPKENVDVVLDKGVLTIEGRVEGEEPEMTLQRREYEVGNFHRRFAVGEGLDPENIQATVKNGVLRLDIPKAERYQPRRIEIEGE